MQNITHEMENLMFDDKEREEIIQLLKRQTEYFRANPAAAREFLIRGGFYAPDGEVAPAYREDPEDPRPQLP